MKPGFWIALVAAVILGFLWWSRHQANKAKKAH
jgi:hypothetical protein